METEIDEERPVQRDARYLRDKRIVEALLFASPKPLSEEDFTFHLGPDGSLDEILAELAADYAPRGVNLLRTAGKWAFRTAEDLGHLLVREREEPRRLSRAALETLAIIAYHQPVTRAEIEEIRGVATSKGTVDVLLETNWIKLRGRRKAPGRPVTYGTTEAFLDQFGLQAIGELPGLSELKGAGFFDGRLPADFDVPEPSDSAELRPDEDPLDEDLFVLIAEERAGVSEEALEAGPH
ncbi:MAG: SMC-Scp complex subunit ScpB [Beijerinckiaceae bacterium]|nr:SMC-Scp complex subunit ScpB [Beijerinckiaceae bacterium]